MGKIGSFDWFAYVLVLLGALNWGLVGIFDYNFVHAMFGEGILTKIIYILVGFSAVYIGFLSSKTSKK